MKNKIKNITLISALTSALFFTGCTPEEQAMATGAVAGVAAAGAVYSSPHYYNRPYYYDNGRYYYGGHYDNGFYYYHGHRLATGHYYDGGYRYYNGRRYRAVVGHYGYYQNKSQYIDRHTPLVENRIYRRHDTKRYNNGYHYARKSHSKRSIYKRRHR